MNFSGEYASEKKYYSVMILSQAPGLRWICIGEIQSRE